jgi:tetratricopeptide (TPR) repeat protein
MADPDASLATYNSFIAEGGTFEQAGNYEKAIVCYSKVGCWCPRVRARARVGGKSRGVPAAPSLGSVRTRRGATVAACMQALEAITTAGVLQNPIGIHCFCSRSKCHLKLGDHDAALADAEEALKDDPNFIKVKPQRQPPLLRTHVPAHPSHARAAGPLCQGGSPLHEG